jgi:hypothetical protein
VATPSRCPANHVHLASSSATGGAAVRHYARGKMSSYEQWLWWFLLFHQMRHQRQMGEAEINTFLSHLAIEENVSGYTRNQAVAVLQFLYRTVLSGDVGNLEGVIRARKQRAFPWSSRWGGCGLFCIISMERWLWWPSCTMAVA